MTLDEYRAQMAAELKAKPKRNDDPEHRLQCGFAICLLEVLPPEVTWTADAAGVRVTEATARKMKEAGVRRGWPDLRFLFPDAITRYIEVKTPTGSLTREQRDFRDLYQPLGIWALARRWSQVEEPLARWCALNRLTLRPLNPITRARYGA